jgi:hypothetical protein
MSQLTRVEYRVPAPSALQLRVGEVLADGRILAHRCPQCARVYVPPRGYCPLCAVPTGPSDELEVHARGIVTTFSVITPLQYPGQLEKDDYVQATILLDGSDSTVGMQRLDGIPIADVRTGLRVEAVWAAPDNRSTLAAAGRGGLGDAITGWRPTGEPDAPLADYEQHIL